MKSQSAHGLHSPFVFNLYKSAIRKKKRAYPEFPEKRRVALLNNSKKITLDGFGAGSILDNSTRITIKKHASNSLKGKRESQLLYRILHHLEPQRILELGTSFGVSTLYLKAACPNAEILTIEGEQEIQSIAKQGFKSHMVNSYCLDLDTDLRQFISKNDYFDCVIFDANHRLKPTIDYFNTCLEKISIDGFFIIDDIYWSKEMTEAWDHIKNHPEVTVSIDLFHFGIVFFRKEQRKEQFTLRQFQLLH